MKRGVFVGTFDPVTKGHVDIVNKSLEIFDEILVAILINPNKTAFFDVDSRLGMLRTTFADQKNVKVRYFEGLLVDLLKKVNTRFLIRGIRNTTDYDYETTMNYVHKSLYPEMITIYFPTDQKNMHINSSFVRELIKFNEDISKYVPDKVKDLIYKELIKKKNV